MRLFTALYDKALAWAKHRFAIWILGGMSFAESSFFPIPPDVMLAPMVLAKPNRAWFYAFVTTMASALGGAFGYLLGHLAIDAITPWLQQAGYWHYFEQANAWFSEWGVWAIFVAGFSPIPYKVFTIAAGAAGMSFVPFLIASIIGRGARFFMVAGIMYWGGTRMENILRQYMEYLGWLVVVAAVVVYLSV